MWMQSELKRWINRFRSAPSNADDPCIDDFGTLFIDICEALQIDSAIEVGAHAAEFSSAIFRRMPNLKVVALEANPYVHAKYKAFVAVGIDYLNLAASCDESPIELHVVRSIEDGGKQREIDPANTISGLLVRSAQNASYDTVRIDATSIDIIARQRSMRRVALWIDVEGANEIVLRGANTALEDQVVCLIVEVEEHGYWKDQWMRDDVDKFLVERGFTQVAKEPVDRPQYNVVYVRSDQVTNDFLARIESAF